MLVRCCSTLKPSMEGVKELLQHLVEKHGGGARLTVYQHGTLLLDSCCGPVQESSLFYVASCTKFVTNVCVARLVDQGVLRYDAKVSEYWPNFHANDVSLQELLSHQAGLVHFDEMIDFPTKALSGRSDEEWQSWIAFLERQKPVSPKNQAAYHAVTVVRGKTMEDEKEVLTTEARVFMLASLCFLQLESGWLITMMRKFAFRLAWSFILGRKRLSRKVRLALSQKGLLIMRRSEHRLTRIVQGSHDDKSKRRKPTALSAQAYMPMNNMSSFWKLRDCESPSHIGWGHAQGF